MHQFQFFDHIKSIFFFLKWEKIFFHPIFPSYFSSTVRLRNNLDRNRDRTRTEQGQNRTRTRTEQEQGQRQEQEQGQEQEQEQEQGQEHNVKT